MGSPLSIVLGITLSMLSCASAHCIVRFGYSGRIGPMRWGSLCPDYSTCSHGHQQSPIDIIKHEAEFDPNLHPLHRYYASSNATLVDNGFNIMVRYEGDVGYIFVEGKNYTLKQMHWHSPSEHTMDGERFPVELHMVHVSDDGNITVVAVLFKYGKPDPFLAKFINIVKEMARAVHVLGNNGPHIPIGLIDAKFIKSNGGHDYYRYVGSLTTPPCNQNVIWTILGNVRDISREQAEILMEPLDHEYRHNSRPTQSLNGRKVRYHRESPPQKAQGS